MRRRQVVLHPWRGVSADAGLTRVTCGECLLRVEGKELVTIPIESATGVADGVLSADGRVVYTAKVGILDVELGTLRRLPQWTLPVHGGEFLLHLPQKRSREPPRVVVRPLKGTAEIGSFEVDWRRGPERLYRSASRHRLDREFVASAAVDRLAVINNATTYIHVHYLGLSSGVSSLVPPAARGQRFTCDLDRLAGRKVAMEFGPDGMSLDAKALRLSWDVPRSARPGSVQVLLNVTTPAGEDAYRRMYVMVR